MLERFRFQGVPFSREFGIEHRHKIPAIEEQVSRIKAVVDQRQSAVLVAPAGCGKTVTIRALRDKLPEARYKTTYLKLADLSSRDMCREIAAALGMVSAGIYPTLVRALEEKLRTGFDSGVRQVMFFDDAHEMRPEVLRLFRLLTNFEMDSRLVVSIVLSGQLPLKKLLMRDDLEDVRQRLVHCGELTPLSREETRGYIEHRLTIAGGKANIFEDQAMEAIYEMSKGNMRAVDKLATASLERADAAGRSRVDAADVSKARVSTWT
jgi:general secretion pathway protein A